MRQVRTGVFETNSSSVHSLTLMMDSDYERWQKGELLKARYSDKIIETSQCTADQRHAYVSHDEYWNEECIGDTFEDSITTPNGEKVVAFGYYGSDN